MCKTISMIDKVKNERKNFASVKLTLSNVLGFLSLVVLTIGYFFLHPEKIDAVRNLFISIENYSIAPCYNGITEFFNCVVGWFNTLQNEIGTFMTLILLACILNAFIGVINMALSGLATVYAFFVSVIEKCDRVINLINERINEFCQEFDKKIDKTMDALQEMAKTHFNSKNCVK